MPAGNVFRSGEAAQELAGFGRIGQQQDEASEQGVRLGDLLPQFAYAACRWLDRPLGGISSLNKDSSVEGSS